MSGPARVKRLTRELQECKKDVHFIFKLLSLSLSRMSIDYADNSRITETLYVDDRTN